MQETNGADHTAKRGQGRSGGERRSPGSVIRSLQLLERLSRAGRGLTLTELSHDIDSPKSTTLKLLRTLQGERFVTYNQRLKIYMLGPTATVLAQRILASPGIRSICRPYLERLAEVSTEDAYLGVKEDGYIVYIDKVEGRQSVRLDIALGTKRYLHSSAVGKLFLADMVEESVRSAVEEGGWRAVTANTLTDPEALREELERIRREGVSISRGENIEGITAIAAPIREGVGTVVAGISVSGPTSRLNDSLESLIDLVRGTAETISADLLQADAGKFSDGGS
ncbi:helix-turn-helix domain-containing protein [Rubrobacter marinus]|uniref:Helix-turn-helix domain-containing protein n=1 Tax=Rubrobacter marinus TaxID=2653852 RepID=A0A6G8PU66_9ACTN|nr:IclR family transcriptional regulator [Rubrobacter marinus]QIN77491.1 helix-turn-helix domain-containing protein [Rubrobacter marinus]